MLRAWVGHGSQLKSGSDYLPDKAWSQKHITCETRRAQGFSAAVGGQLWACTARRSGRCGKGTEEKAPRCREYGPRCMNGATEMGDPRADKPNRKAPGTQRQQAEIRPP